MRSYDHFPTINKATYLTIGVLAVSAHPAEATPISNLHTDDFVGNRPSLANEPSKFSLGTVDKQDRFRQIMPSFSGNWAFGRVVSKNKDEPEHCGWVEDTILQDDTVHAPQKDPCITFRNLLKNPYTFGKDFNCKPGVCVDGKPVTITLKSGCIPTVWGNYANKQRDYSNLTFPRTPGGLYDRLRGLQLNEVVRYRYTTKDGQAAMVRVDVDDYGNGGWTFIDRDCLPDKISKGGTRKHSLTIPGPNPNQKLKLVSISTEVDSQYTKKSGANKTKQTKLERIALRSARQLMRRIGWRQ